ncbi:hypothetical protein FRB99_004910 [Tulasnella sp. 403]|nr:hypothetical protein FRB99_004910 [Tulasnella sp. 403]
MTTPAPAFAVDPVFGPDTAGNCVLQSSDSFKFKVHHIVLSIASPFFRDMFNLPQQSGSLEPGELPVIPMTEDGETIQALLLLIYPGQLTRIQTVELAIKLAVAWDKYLLPPDLLQAALRRTIYSDKEFFQSFPLQMFGLACRLGMDTEARLASRYTHREPLADSNAGTLFQFTGSIQPLLDLQHLRIRREEALDSVVMALLDRNLLCSTHGGTHNIGIGGDMSTHYQTFEAIKEQVREALKTPFPAEKCKQPLLFFGISKVCTVTTTETIVGIRRRVVSKCPTCFFELSTQTIEKIASAVAEYPQEVGCRAR